jgi:predicted TIM-barrel fold metal-dependent hydrolase
VHPVEILKRNFWFTSIEDPSAFHQLEQIGAERIMLETDYPHPDSSWPTSQQLFRSELAHLSAGTAERIYFRNAANLYQHPVPAADWMTAS